MKNNNYFKWIPYAAPTRNIDEVVGGITSSEELLLYRAAVALDLAHRGSSAGIAELALHKGTEHLPVIQA